VPSSRCTQFCFRNSGIFADIVEILGQFPDLDKLLSHLTIFPKTWTSQTIQNGIDALISLRFTIKLVYSLNNCLRKLIPNSSSGLTEDGNSEIDSVATNSTILFSEMLKHCEDPSLKNMDSAINQLLNESTTFSKSSIIMKQQECFAIRNGLNGLLDVTRATYTQLVEDIYEVLLCFCLFFSSSSFVMYSPLFLLSSFVR
jgi:hypothetical protein